MKKFLLALILSTPLLSQAQGFQVNLQGQKEQGMAGAGTGLMQDASAVFFNPGGVSFLQNNSALVGMTPTFANGTFLDKDNGTVWHSNAPIGTPFTAYVVWGPDSNKLKFGFGVYTPFGSIASWPTNWTGGFALTYMKLQSEFFQPTVSYKVSNKLGIGIGVVYAMGQVEFRQNMPLQFSDGSFGVADLTANASNWGFNAGIYYTPTDKLSIGLTYRSQINMNVKNGTANFTVPSAVAADFPSGPFTSMLPLPQVATLGIGYTVNDKLSFAFDANFDGWSSLDTIAFHYQDTTAQLKTTKLPRDYKNAYAFRLGAQYHVTDKFTVRAGVAYSISPVPAGYVTPEVPDANKVNLTCGVGYKFCSKLVADASLTFENLTRTDDNLALNLNGTYKTYILAPGLSVIYQF